MTDQPKRISDLLQDLNFPMLTKDLEDLAGKDVRIDYAKMATGEFGEFAVMAITEPDTGDKSTVTCGGKNVVSAIARLITKELFPVTAKFEKKKLDAKRSVWTLS
jgi:hypothetical protein